MCKTTFLYEARHNPSIIYEEGLDDLDPKNPEDAARRPEVIAEDPSFRTRAEALYAEKVRSHLMRKEWFARVDALEMFTNYWSYGRNLGSMPTHNIYVPVRHTILPRPKFRDYDVDDQEGKAFTYRTHDEHTPQVARHPPNTLKPVAFTPQLPSSKVGDSHYAWLKETPRPRYGKYRRLSKSRGTGWTSVNMPLKWKFSTLIRQPPQCKDEGAIADSETSNQVDEIKANPEGPMLSFEALVR